MVDYREHYNIPATDLRNDIGETGYTGPLIALAVIVLLIGSVLFFSTGPQTGQVETTAPAVTTQPAEPAAIPAE